jgi:prohibitin 1
MEKFFDRLGFLGIGLLGVGLVGTRFIFVVEPGERVVVFNKFKGVQEKVYGEGMHFKIPVIMVPNYFEIRTRPRMTATSTGTRDLQQVNLSLRILFRPLEASLPRLLNQYGIDYDDKIYQSISNEVLKSIVA